MVPRRGLEPPRPCERQHLKLVRLPIPPPGHGIRICGRPARLKARGPPCQRAAQGLGRHAMIERAEELVTVFGGGGFIGRYVCEWLFRRRPGARRQRDPRGAYFIQPLAPGRPVRVRPGRHHQCRQRSQRGQRRHAVVNLAGCSAGDARGPRRGRAQRRRGRARRAAREALVQISAIGADPARNPPTAGPRARARRQCARRSRARRSSARRSCSGPRTSSPTASRDGPAAVPAGDRRQAEVPAGLCPRPRARRSPRPRSSPARYRRQDLRDRRPAGAEHGELHHAILEITGRTPEIVDASRLRREACCRASAGCPARR